jgi:acetoacetyl-CoA synthetase
VDALVLDLPRGGQVGSITLFVVLRPGDRLDAELVARIAARLREDYSPRHVPDEVHQVAEVPRTLSGKLVELPVKRILLGADPASAVSRDALANPTAIDIFVELAARGGPAVERPPGPGPPGSAPL